MKKRVRVYKMGSQTEQPSQEQQIISYLEDKMSSNKYNGNTGQLTRELVNAGIPRDEATKYITYVSDNLDNPEEEVEEDTTAADEAYENEQEALRAQEEADDAAEEERLNQMYNVEIDPSTTQDTEEDTANLNYDDEEEGVPAPPNVETNMKYGGSNLSKRSFIKQYTKFAKMAQGGDTPSTGSTDIPGDKGRERQGLDFINGLKSSAQDAVMRKEAEEQYSAYGAPQVGAFQVGGVQSGDSIGNPLNDLNTYGQDVRNVFSDDMYRRNDGPQIAQYGGFKEEGLYKFIGGGDNESSDEDYDDADLPYNQYARGGRASRKYLQEINSPYYTGTGERVPAPDLEGRQVTSVVRNGQGLFKPTKYTYNYGDDNASRSEMMPQIKMPTEDQARTLDANAANAATMGNVPNTPQQARNNRQPVADMMMRSGIPGIKQMGARMTRSGMIPEIPADSQPTSSAAAPASNEPYYPPMNARAQRRERRDDAQLNRFLGNTAGVDVMNKLNAPASVNGDVDPSVTASLNAYKNDPETYAEVKAQAKVQDKKEEANVINKEEEKINAVVNPALQGEKVQAAINNNTVGGLNRKALDYDYANDPEAKAFQKKYPSFSDGNDGRNEEFWSQQQPQGANKYSPEKAAKMKEMGLNPDIYGHHYLFQHPDKFKEYGGPVDYTQYAYGGDIAIPELHKYQIDGQVAFDPNNNNMSINNLQGYFDKPPTQDATGNAIQATVPENMQPQATKIEKDKYAMSQDYLLNKDKSDSGGRGAIAGKVIGGLFPAAQAATGILNARNNNELERKFMEKNSAIENIAGTSDALDFGNHEINQGNFRPNEGFKGVIKYGGGIYATGGSTEDEDEDVEYMTEDQIKRFLAEGGELEYV